MGFLTPPNPITNFQIRKHYQNRTKFNGVYLINNLPETKDGVYVINLDECKSITHWIDLYVNGDTSDSFGVEDIPEEIKKIRENKNIETNIYRIQTYSPIMCRYFCTGFIDFMQTRI